MNHRIDRLAVHQTTYHKGQALIIKRLGSSIGYRQDAASIKDGTLALTKTPAPRLDLKSTPVRPRFAGPVSPAAGMPKIKIAPEVAIIWDVAELGGEINAPTGSGKMDDHSRVCSLDKASSFYALYTKTKVFNSVCSRKVEFPTLKRKYNVTHWKDFGAGISPMPPTVTMQYRRHKNQWSIVSVTAYAVVRWAEPTAGFHPICGKNVTINKSDGIRGNPPTTDPHAKGYYVDVAKNLSLYKGAADKPMGKIFWWVPGATERHEKAHLEYTKDEFKRLSAFLLRQTAIELEKRLREKRIDPVNQQELEHNARAVLDGKIQWAKRSDLISAARNEDHVSKKTAEEFKKEAAKILKWGKAQEAKTKK